MHIALALLIASLIGNMALGFSTWRTITDLENTKTTLRASEQAETRLHEQVATCETTSTISTNVASYFGGKLGELDDILIATDNAALDFINWCAENGTFYGDALTEGNRRHATWVAKQEQTNKDYAALMVELREFIDTLEAAAAAQDTGIRHAF